jgi:hypothetical protein
MSFGGWWKSSRIRSDNRSVSPSCPQPCTLILVPRLRLAIRIPERLAPLGQESKLRSYDRFVQSHYHIEDIGLDRSGHPELTQISPSFNLSR